MPEVTEQELDNGVNTKEKKLLQNPMTPQPLNTIASTCNINLQQLTTGWTHYVYINVTNMKLS